MLENKWCVYKHTNKTNGKVYIGITSKSPTERWGYGRGYHHNAHMTSAIEKYDWDGFTHEVLVQGLSQDDALDLERKLIAEYQSADRRYGYNIEAGGRKKGSFSPETLEKMRQRMLGENNHNYGKHLSEETRRKLSECNRGEKNPHWGTHRSPETRAKISASEKGRVGSLLGKHHSEETKAKIGLANAKAVCCVETGVIYPSATMAGRMWGISSTAICDVCRHKKNRVTSGGYHWEFVEEVSV